jgi:hypothetical protein
MTTALGRTVSLANLKVSPLCLGMVDEPSTVIAAWNAGINFFFVTADMHWPLYEGVRSGLRELAKARPAALDQAVIACCSYVAQPEFLSMPFQEALGALAPFRKLDVLVAGGSYAPDVNARLGVLRANMKSGLVGASAIGASIHGREAAVNVVNGDSAEVVFVRYNAQHPGARLDLFPALKATRTAKLFNFKSTSAYIRPEEFHKMGVDPELWFPSVTDHYRFVLCRPELNGLLVAPRDPKQLEQLVDAYLQGPLSADEEGHLLALAKLALDHAQAQPPT